jgi:hypothetical protein
MKSKKKKQKGCVVTARFLLFFLSPSFRCFVLDLLLMVVGDHATHVESRHPRIAQESGEELVRTREHSTHTTYSTCCCVAFLTIRQFRVTAASGTRNTKKKEELSVVAVSVLLVVTVFLQRHAKNRQDSLEMELQERVHKKTAVTLQRKIRPRRVSVGGGDEKRHDQATGELKHDVRLRHDNGAPCTGSLE